MHSQEFYRETLATLLRDRLIDREMRVLVVCAGRHDAEALANARFTNVVLSNINPVPQAHRYTPYTCDIQDVEHLTYGASSFDLSIVNSGLHHCYSPHRALLEMYRVSRCGVLLFEPYDNWLTRLGVALNIGQEYEHNTVIGHQYGAGNSQIPNYVYRFTEREIIKTVSSFSPYGLHRFRFFHSMRIPRTHLRRRRKSKAAYLTVLCAMPVLKTVEWLAPKQSNHFAAVIIKPDLPAEGHPWLFWESGQPKVNPEWLAQRYHGVNHR